MSIAKDDSIIALLSKLDLHRRGWVTRDNWEADLCAIGISSPSLHNRLIYVSTFGKQTGKYDYECEDFPLDAKDETDYVVVEEGHDVVFSELLDAMQRHLE